MDKRFLGILGAIIVIFVGIFAFSQHKSSNGSSSGNSGAQPTNHVQGEGQKGVKLVEYGDYQCPICGEYYLPLKQVVNQYSKDIYFQFSNLPLTAIHQNAFAAARAAEAAGMQNKYWQMHDRLYENQNSWSGASDAVSIFTSYAQAIGLNLNQFKQDYASGKVNDSINADIAAFDKTGQEKATPAMFLNGVFVPNSQFVDPQTGQPSPDAISKLIQDAINKKSTSSNY